MEQLLEFLWEHSMDTDIMQAQKTDSRYIEAEAYTHKVQKQIENKGFRDCIRLIVEAMGEKN